MQGSAGGSGPAGAPVALAEMFQRGQRDIPVSRSSDLFGQLEGRQLSEEESGIIARRVALQQGLLAAYERREHERKAQAVARVFPQLPAPAVEQLLASHSSEDDAIEALLTDPDLLARLQGARGPGPTHSSKLDAPAAAQSEPEQLLPAPPQPAAKKRRTARGRTPQLAGTADARPAQGAAAEQPAASPCSPPGGSSPATPEPPGSAGASAAARPARRAARGVSQLVQAMQAAPAQPRGRPLRQQAAARAPRAQQPPTRAPDGSSPGPSAPSRKPRLGRVKKCSTKAVQLLAAGRLRVQPGWHNGGYIFPQGFRSATSFRSSVRPDESCQHVCSIVGRGGACWPAPTFQIVADDRPAEPVVAKSATGAWAAVLARINAAIRQRREAGEDLPPPPGTAIPGPEFFGLTNEAIVSAIEQLDPGHQCAAYWQGKQERAAFIRAHGTTPQKRRLAGAPRPPVRRGREASPSVSISSASEREAAPGGGGEGSETEAVSSRWAALDRAERRAKRHGSPAAEAGAEGGEAPLLPGVLDPITLQQVRAPAMSPVGHVMGAASWAAVLAERGHCPFTQQPLRRQQLVLLTPANIERLRDRLILR